MPQLTLIPAEAPGLEIGLVDAKELVGRLSWLPILGNGECKVLVKSAVGGLTAIDGLVNFNTDVEQGTG